METIKQPLKLKLRKIGSSSYITSLNDIQDENNKREQIMSKSTGDTRHINNQKDLITDYSSNKNATSSNIQEISKNIRENILYMLKKLNVNQVATDNQDSNTQYDNNHLFNERGIYENRNQFFSDLILILHCIEKLHEIFHQFQQMCLKIEQTIKENEQIKKKNKKHRRGPHKKQCHQVTNDEVDSNAAESTGSIQNLESNVAESSTLNSQILKLVKAIETEVQENESEMLENTDRLSKKCEVGMKKKISELLEFTEEYTEDTSCSIKSDSDSLSPYTVEENIKLANSEFDDKPEQEDFEEDIIKLHSNISSCLSNEQDFEKQPSLTEIQSEDSSCEPLQSLQHDLNFEKDPLKNVSQVLTEVSENSKKVLKRKRDSFNTTWTLKHKAHDQLVVELIPKSGIYIHEIYLDLYTKKAENSFALARMLLCGIFNDDALDSCHLSCSKRILSSQRDFTNNKAQQLDQQALNTLWEFVDQEQLKRSDNIQWKICSRDVVMNDLEIYIEKRRKEREKMRIH